KIFMMMFLSLSLYRFLTVLHRRQRVLLRVCRAPSIVDKTRRRDLVGKLMKQDDHSSRTGARREHATNQIPIIAIAVKTPPPVYFNAACRIRGSLSVRGVKRVFRG